jgi:hypothetical protein
MNKFYTKYEGKFTMEPIRHGNHSAVYITWPFACFSLIRFIGSKHPQQNPIGYPASNGAVLCN